MNVSVPSFTFIVPALNEEKSLPAVMEEIITATHKSGVVDYEVVFVDDGSSDGTAAVAMALSSNRVNVTVIRNKTRQGVGKSFLAGVTIAQKDYCLIVPGDNEFSLDFLPAVVSALSADEADFAVTYVANPESRPYHRRFFSRMYINFFNALFRTDFLYTNGIVIYPTVWIRKVKLISEGYTFQSEALLKAHRDGKRFATAGMIVRPRVHGKSKIFAFKSIKEILASLIRMKLADF